MPEQTIEISTQSQEKSNEREVGQGDEQESEDFLSTL